MQKTKTFSKGNMNSIEFRKQDKSPLNRIASTISKTVTGAAREFARESALSLAQEGLSVDTISNIASRRADSIVSDSSNEFFKMVASRERLESIRKNRVQQNSKMSSNPDIKIREKQKEYESAIVAVL